MDRPAIAKQRKAGPNDSQPSAAFAATPDKPDDLPPLSTAARAAAKQRRGGDFIRQINWKMMMDSVPINSRKQKQRCPNLKQPSHIVMRPWRSLRELLQQTLS